MVLPIGVLTASATDAPVLAMPPSAPDATGAASPERGTASRGQRRERHGNEQKQRRD